MLMPNVKRVAGFTLLELVVAMGIFGILVVVTVPVMRTWVCNVKVRSVCDALQNGVRLAQSESLRRSRQVVFSLTNSTTPQTLGFTAVANGTYWSIYTIPSMTDGTEAPTLIDSGVLSNSANVTITGPAAICFNSTGRLVTNSSAGVIAVTNGPTCAQPTAGTPPRSAYAVNLTGADRPLEVDVYLGGQVHMCITGQALSSANPEGC
jgi:type IV fimbrial biogenesis protein FimT